MNLIYRIWRHPITRGLLRRLIPRAVRGYYRAYRQGYFHYDKTRVVLYADPAVLPEYTPRHPPAGRGESGPTPQATDTHVTLVTTLLHPVEEIRTWLDALGRQTRLPDEVVIADRGAASDAKTVLQEFAQSASFPIRTVDASGKSVAAALNLAIQNAAFPLIASTEIGCLPEADWLENLLFPLVSDPDIQVSAGFYTGQSGSMFQRLCAYLRAPEAGFFNPAIYEPALRSVAMRKTAWLGADRFPEWLGNASGETLFFFQARQNVGLWAVVPGAVVKLPMPANIAELARTRYLEGLSDGVTGIRAGAYWRNTLNLAKFIFLPGFVCLALVAAAHFFIGWVGWLMLAALLVSILLILMLYLVTLARSYHFGLDRAIVFLCIRFVGGLARMSGFAAGVRKRPVTEARRLEHFQDQLQRILDRHPQHKGIVIYPPTHDWGYMFQLPQQMARQLARRGYLYFYGTANEKTDGVTGFQEVEPNLFVWHVPFETFQITGRAAANPPLPGSGKVILYIGSPWNRKYLDTLIDPAQKNRPCVVYDHYDDLAVSSGRPEDHRYLLQTADVVLVTSQRLFDNVKDFRPDTIFAPNGVDYEQFQRLRPGLNEQPPVDLQPILARGKPIVGYTGAFSERFDYDLFQQLAKSRPQYEFVLVGANIDGSLDRSGLLKTGLGNVTWLGMKSHDELIRYMWHFQIGIVPFKINEITLATTSIKVFEYMACQLPVVSVDMPESRRYVGVFIATTYEQFIEYVDTAITKKMDSEYLALIDQVARSNTWENRANILVERLAGSFLL